MEYARAERSYGPVADRVRHFKEFVIPLAEPVVRHQATRCMDCGIPFCHQGCPVDNIIPHWNDLVFQGRWEEALRVLHSTNNFPEFTGRVCPAPCEAACTLNFTDHAVNIKTIECAIVDRGWKEGAIIPQIPLTRTHKRIAVVGSGPAGLACAQQLARAGHSVVVFEKNPRIGGLLRYGIPDFKMAKHLIDRRIAQMQAEGVEFRVNQNVGENVPTDRLLKDYDAIALTGGAEQPRDLPIPGRELDGVEFAMDFLSQQNRRIAGDPVTHLKTISAKDKDVIVIGGGDTGSDCVGTSIRHGARSVTQLEILPKPPVEEDKMATWPDWPTKLRTSSSHQEGCNRQWSVGSRAFIGEHDRLIGLKTVRLKWEKDEHGSMNMHERDHSEEVLPADLVLLAMGFVHPVQHGLLEQIGVDTDERKNVKADERDYKTSVNKVFAAGDIRRGQSLVVWAIREGRRCAKSIDGFLVGDSGLAD